MSLGIPTTLSLMTRSAIVYGNLSGKSFKSSFDNSFRKSFSNFFGSSYGNNLLGDSLGKSFGNSFGNSSDILLGNIFGKRFSNSFGKLYWQVLRNAFRNSSFKFFGNLSVNFCEYTFVNKFAFLVQKCLFVDCVENSSAVFYEDSNGFHEISPKFSLGDSSVNYVVVISTFKVLLQQFF